MALEDILQVQDRYYILASSYTDAPRRVLKEGDSFGVFDSRGDIRPLGNGEQGVYHLGARYLSGLTLRLFSRRPLLLSSGLSRDNLLLAVDLMNPDIHDEGRVAVPRGTLHVFRQKFLWRGTCHERLRLTNFGRVPLPTVLSLEFHSDFVDVFEVRGTRRERRGEHRPPLIDAESVTLEYLGLDGVVRRARMSASPPPAAVHADRLDFRLELAPGESREVMVQLHCHEGETPLCETPYEQARSELQRSHRESLSDRCEVSSSNELFDDWLRCSQADLDMMVTRTRHGSYPYAGVPWFSTPFGRDGIITALQTLWVDPGLARGVLAFLAGTQSHGRDPERDAEPGKVIHELRHGEMAATGEIPFGRYYGSIDATPLFVMLAGAYLEATADSAFVLELWPAIEEALTWLDVDGDSDGDGFVEYARRSSSGLVHQGWKDSGDSIFHADGETARGPIALCEVQGYVYAARLEAARVAEALNRRELAAVQRDQAAALRERFERAFWCEELSTYALALDGEKRPCGVRTSNAGQVLLSGLPAPDRAARVAETLFGAESFSGWGIRTVASSEARYNPMSYHNGSIWPHDNALIAVGLARYGLKDHALRLLTALFDASCFMEGHRLPELFCGFERRPGEAPTLYPVACSPQAWSSGAVFLLLQACLGLSVSAPRGQVRFQAPVLPGFLEEVSLRRLRVGASSVDLSVRGSRQDVSIHLLRRDGPVEVIVAE